MKVNWRKMLKQQAQVWKIVEGIKKSNGTRNKKTHNSVNSILNWDGELLIMYVHFHHYPFLTK